MSVSSIYQSTKTTLVISEDHKREKQVLNCSYYLGGFILYPVLKQTRLLNLIKRLVAALLVKTITETKIEHLSNRRIISNILAPRPGTTLKTATKESEKILFELKHVVKDFASHVTTKNRVKAIQNLEAVKEQVRQDFQRLPARVSARKTIQKSIRDIALRCERSEFVALTKFQFSDSTQNIIDDAWNTRFKVNAPLVDEVHQNMHPTQLSEWLVPESEMPTRTMSTEKRSELHSIRKNVASIRKHSSPDALLIFRLDLLRAGIEKTYTSSSILQEKNETIQEIESAIDTITSNSLGAKERAKLYEFARKGFLSKKAREILQGVLFISENPYIRTTQEICQEVLDEIGVRLKNNPSPNESKLLNNIKLRYKQNLRRCSMWQPTLMDRVEALKTIAFARYESKEQTKGLDTLVRIFLAKQSIEKGEIPSDYLSGKSDSELLSLAKHYGVSTSFLSSTSRISSGEKTYLKKKIGVKMYKKSFSSNELQSFQYLTPEEKKNVYQRKYLPEGYESWKNKSQKERKALLNEAYETLQDYVNLPSWYHCTRSGQILENVVRKGVEVLPAITGTGSFASTDIEAGGYGSFCVALDERVIVGNVPVIHIPHVLFSDLESVWVGCSEPISVSIFDQKKKWLGLDAAYIAVSDTESPSIKELEDDKTVFIGTCQQKVKSVHKYLKSKGWEVTVVSVDEANLEKDLLRPHSKAQTIKWSQGFPLHLNYSSYHPTLHSSNNKKYKFCE